MSDDHPISTNDEKNLFIIINIIEIIPNTHPIAEKIKNLTNISL